MDKSEDKRLSCVDCGTGACRLATPDKVFPSFCINNTVSSEQLAEVRALFDDDENHLVMEAAAVCEALGRMTRVEETVRFAREMGFRRIGVATCIRLRKEANALAKVLKYHGFEVFGVSCKCGRIKKSEIGLNVDDSVEKINICNPILQAELLAQEKTEFNIMLGLCVGHDSLFYKYSQALTTTLITKDKMTGHNPAVILYQIEGNFKDVMNKGE